MGSCVQTISEHVSLIASQQTWIEGLAIQQLIKTAELKDMKTVVGMPDLHPGRGYPIGAAFLSTQRIYPALVGNDIGCGMGLWQTSIKTAKLNIDKLAKQLTQLESPLDDTWSDIIATRKAEKQIDNNAYNHALGTIGGGNHFAEFQAIDEVYDQDELAILNIDKKRLQLLVHSGSRGLGQSILMNHIREFNHDGLAITDTAFKAYMSEHNEALRWAELNRELIALRFAAAVKTQAKCILDINHNLVSAKQVNNEAAWLHRKGATPSDQGVVVIPGSRGDHTYLVKPIPSANSLYSLAHGAGRKWKRGECQGRLSHKYKREDLQRTDFGSRVICNNKELLYDEAPQAYKKCATIISDLEDAGLIKVIARLRPVVTFKTNGECHS